MNELMQQISGKRDKMYYLSRLIVIGLCVIIALTSFFVLSDTFSSIERYKHEVSVLDEKRATATELSIAAVGASAGITMIPDDACTPIANELAVIGKDLAIISGIILLEKYLMTILGYAFFKAIVPICLAIYAFAYWKDISDPMRSSLLSGSIKLLIVGAILWQAVPISVHTIDLFDETYQETLSQAIESAQQAGSIAEDDKAIEEVSSEKEGNASKGIRDKVLDAIGSATDAVTSGLSKATNGVSVLVAWAKVVLTQVTEGFVVLLVTSCVVPMAFPLVAYWFVKIFFQSSGTSIAVMQIPAMQQSGREALPASDEAEQEEELAEHEE